MWVYSSYTIILSTHFRTVLNEIQFKWDIIIHSGANLIFQLIGFSPSGIYLRIKYDQMQIMQSARGCVREMKDEEMEKKRFMLCIIHGIMIINAVG